MKLEITIKLRAAVRYDSAADIWVSWCPALDIYSQGTTRERAQAAVEEALLMYVRFCYRQNILDNTLNKRGFVADGYDTSTSAADDDALEEFINVRVVDDQPKRSPLLFDVTVPLSLMTHGAQAAIV